MSSCFSRVYSLRLWTKACQAPLSTGFSRQGHWSASVAISFSDARKWKVKVKLFSHVWLFATPWTAPHGSSVHGILQARTLEWGAIAFSNLLHLQWAKKLFRAPTPRNRELSVRNNRNTLIFVEIKTTFALSTLHSWKNKNSQIIWII